MRQRSALGLAGVALVPIACCAALPLLAAAGASVSLGAAAGGVAVLATTALVTRQLLTRQTREEALVGDDCCTPTTIERDTDGAAARRRAGPLVEILYFDGCPNHEGARELVERVSREMGIQPELRLVNVPDEEVARRLRFLGSPTIRVAGEDVDPHAGERDDYALSCRVYRTDHGVRGQPDEHWVREALEREASKQAGAASNTA